MQFDAALAAQTAFHHAEDELGADWETAVALEEAFSSQAGHAARDAYDALLTLATRHPHAHSFHAFCIYITWSRSRKKPSHATFTPVSGCVNTFSPQSTGKDLRTSNRSESCGSRSGRGWEWRKRTICKSNTDAIRPRAVISTNERTWRRVTSTA